MLEVSDTRLGSGRVMFSKAIPADLALQSSGSPSHFEVTFSIAFEVRDAGAEVFNAFEMRIPVVTAQDHSPYRSTESEAARQIAPMLRAVADQIDQEIARFEAEYSASAT